LQEKPSHETLRCKVINWSRALKNKTNLFEEDSLKKTLIIALILLTAALVWAEVPASLAARTPYSQTRSRTEVIAYQENFETGATGWTTQAAIGANLWHIAEVADAPSPTHAMINQNAQGSYNPTMQNYLISPEITLPLSGQIKADFMMKGDFTDPSQPTSASVLDYWFWDISVLQGGTWSAWYRMSNPYNSPTGTNYIFIDAPPEWTYVTESYNGLDGYISDYAGYTVKFRICFRADSDTPDGTGIMVDNFTIFNDIFLPAPTSLTAAIAGQTVELNWTAPPSGFSSETITSTNSAWTSYVSDADAFAMKITNPFNTPLQLHGVKFMLYRANSSPIIGNPTIHVFENSSGMPGNELLNVPNVANIANMQWKEVDITSYNVMIPASGAVFVGISNIADGGADGQGLLCDSTSVSLDSYAMFEGTWDTLNNTYTGLHNCALAGTYWVDDPFAPILTGFKVYRATNQNDPYDLIATLTNPASPTYTDASPVVGQVNYYKVTGLFQTYESEPSNIASIDLIGLLYTEEFNDDGSSNQNFNLGASASSAVKFVTDPNVQIFYSKVFLNAVGNSALITRIYDADGANGLPGTMLLQYTTAVSNLSTGWNNLPLPAANIITDPDGTFYIAVMEYASAPTFALDTDTSGDSWKKMSSTAAWEPITEGNVMIRALVNWGMSNEDPIEVMPVANLSSYPNPFSQKTDISFELNKAQDVSLKIYNLKGQLVRDLSSGSFAKGTHKISWDGRDNSGSAVSHGIYFSKLEADGKTLTRKLLRTK
jgi:hypothetical protein